MNAAFKLYKEYYIDKSDERRELFDELRVKFKLKSGLYPGSFVHITPSLYIPKMAYIDTDKRCGTFFSSEWVNAYIAQEKKYDEKTEMLYIDYDFTKPELIIKEKYDLLISLYSGFISQFCNRHLKKNGLLLVNNSHGDASLAQLDKSYGLIAAVIRRGSQFRIADVHLDEYFKTKTGKPIDKEKILKTMTGPVYLKTAYAYVFRKIK